MLQHQNRNEHRMEQLNEIELIKDQLARDDVSVPIKNIERAILLPDDIPIPEKEPDPKAKKPKKDEPPPEPK